MPVSLRLLLLALLTGFASPAVGERRPVPPTDCGDFSCRPRPAPPPVPDPIALDAARRIVKALDMGIVGQRTAELRALASAREGTPPPPRPSNVVRATPPVDLAAIPYWSYPLQERVVDHAALYYLGNYSRDELARMAAFVESAAGRRLMADSQPRRAEVAHAVATSILEDDLWDIVCGIPPRRALEDGIHFRFDEYHRMIGGFALPARAHWCTAVEAELASASSR